MKSVAAGLRDRVAATVTLLRAIPDAEAARKPAADRWSKKEILGHLIDSACNNHVRFVRAQLEQGMSGPRYEQDGWVRSQGYADADWILLIEFWAAYNRHLANVIDRLPAAVLTVECRIGGDHPVTLAWLVEDYVQHMDHHLLQLARPDR